jgi:hypothetical protein
MALLRVRQLDSDACSSSNCCSFSASVDISSSRQARRASASDITARMKANSESLGGWYSRARNDASQGSRIYQTLLRLGWGGNCCNSSTETRPPELKNEYGAMKNKRETPMPLPERCCHPFRQRGRRSKGASKRKAQNRQTPSTLFVFACGGVVC